MEEKGLETNAFKEKLKRYVDMDEADSLRLYLTSLYNVVEDDN